MLSLSMRELSVALELVRAAARDEVDADAAGLRPSDRCRRSLTATSSNASKSKYDDEAPPELVSVMTTPSRFHIVSVAERALADEAGLLAASLPPTFTRSTMTPGTVLSTAHGSFDCGVPCSSAVVSVVDGARLLDVDDR